MKHPQLMTNTKLAITILLSEEHNTDRLDEQKRIEDVGWFINDSTRTVCSMISITRAFGNRIVKKYVIAKPEIQEAVALAWAEEAETKAKRSFKHNNSYCSRLVCRRRHLSAHHSRHCAYYQLRKKIPLGPQGALTVPFRFLLASGSKLLRLKDIFLRKDFLYKKTLLWLSLIHLKLLCALGMEREHILNAP
ncbi:hypothetical protein V6Z11_D04G004700 [Gossypium hirsutum]